MSNILYYILLSLVYSISLLPLGVLYVFSDFTCFMIHRVIKYRVKIVRKNLRDSFPEKSESELRQIETDFYSWFCDYIFETVKMFSMSKKEMMKRMKFENMEDINQSFRNKRCISVLTGHYGNWEWGSSIQLHVTDGGMVTQIYHHLESSAMDRLLLYSRGRFGSTSIEMKESFAKLLSWKKQGICHLTGYIADQAPGYDGMHFWCNFLNHPKTPGYSGAERIARLLDTDCFYMQMSRPKRGYYVARMIKITDDPNSTPKFFVTSEYFRLLEQDIKNNPHLWLWSHNRWKRTWEGFCEAVPDEKKRNMMLSKL